MIFFNDILAYTKCQHVDTNLSFICPPSDKKVSCEKKRINECITQPNLHVQTEEFSGKQRIISDGNTCVTNVHRNCLKCQMACFRLWRLHCLRNQYSVLAHTQKCSRNPTPDRRMNISLLQGESCRARCSFRTCYIINFNAFHDPFMKLMEQHTTHHPLMY